MKPFSPAELEVMQVLWRHGTLKPAEIQDRFPRPILNAALRSILLILLDKKHVSRRKTGRAYYYKALTPPDHTMSRMVRRLAEIFCGGSTPALIAHLIRSEKLDAEDIRELQKIAGEKLVQTRTPARPPRKEPRP
jgi:BlaI family transcriptional regulator, penicillinase repressor